MHLCGPWAEVYAQVGLPGRLVGGVGGAGVVGRARVLATALKPAF